MNKSVQTVVHNVFIEVSVLNIL